MTHRMVQRMNGSNISSDEKQLALSTLVRREKNDPGAVELLIQLMSDPSSVIRKRSVAISDRFLEQQRTARALLRVATTTDEKTSIRSRSMEKLEILFDPHRHPNRQDVSSAFLRDLKKRILHLLRNAGEPLSLRGQALELAAWFVRDELLQEWILYFHNRQGNICKLSAIAAMGRSGNPRWRNYIQGYMEMDNMDFTCAALEAIAAWEEKSMSALPPESAAAPPAREKNRSFMQ